MKLRNKKTGEIADQVWWDNEADELCINGNKMYFYGSLADLNEEWEDYEEPKEYWFIDYGGRIRAINDSDDEEDKARKQIGNYFETKEEAELAVRKLKAWKRLKDKGFRFWTIDPIHLKIGYSFENYTEEDIPELKKDLYFCFGGEE